MEDITKLDLQSGRIVGEDGKVYNKVSLMKAAGSDAEPIDDKVYDIEKYPASSGRLIGEDGKVYNEVDLLKSIVGADSYSKAESDARFALTTTLNSALADNAAVNRFLVNIDEMMAANTEGTWDTSTDGEYIYTINNADFTVSFNAGGWVTNITENQTEFTDADFKIYLWKNKIIPTSEFDEIDYTLYAKVLLSGSNVAFHLEQRNRYDTASLWEEIFLPNDTDYREINIDQTGSKAYFNVYLNIGEESGTASFSDLRVKLLPNTNLDGGLGNDDYYRTQRQLDAAVRELQKSGGIKGRTVEKIYGNTTSTVTPDTVTLSKPYTDFDELVFVAGGYTEGRYYVNNTFTLLTEEIEVSENTWYGFYSNYSDVGESRRFAFSSPTTMVYKQADQTPTGAQLNWHVNFVAIYGIKYDSDYITIDTEMSDTSTNPVQNKIIKEYIDNAGSGGGTTVHEIGTPDYDNRIQFTQADLPYTVPCDGYLYIGGWQSRVSLRYKDADNNYVGLAFASTSGEVAEYGMYPVTKGMILEYNAISGNEARMYIVPMEYNAMSIGRGVEELYVASDTTAPNTITLSQPYTNFDELMFIRHWGSPATSEASFANVADVNVGDLVGVANWDGVKFVEYTVTSTTVLTKNNSGQDGYIYKIYGIKYASKYAKVDNEMSSTSTNPISNAAVTAVINEIIGRIEALEEEK